MTFDFAMPSLGADMERGTIAHWHVEPGRTVARGDIIVDVETDKGTIAVDIWRDGTVTELLAKPGDEITVGTPILRLEELKTVAAAPPPLPIAPGPLSPLVEPSPKVDQAKMRTVISEAMARSKREIPHYYLRDQINMRPTLDWLETQNQSLSVADQILPIAILLRAVALAVAKIPEVNGHYIDNVFSPLSTVHLGVAISLRGGGLVSPAIADAGSKAPREIMKELSRLIERARGGRLKTSDLITPTITVTSLGDTGVDEVFGIIHPPQVALVGFGRIRRVPWVQDGSLCVAPVVNATLSADHRVSDGLRGALFLSAIHRLLAHPEDLGIGEKSPISRTQDQTP